MHYLRNPEVAWVFWPDLLIAAASGFLLHRFARDGQTWLVVLTAIVTFALMGIIFLAVSVIHGKKVVRFTARIEKNLNGHKDLQFDDFREGDFSVLQSKVSKMVEVHFQQESMLQAEKERLVEEFVNISHEIKTPLQIMTLNTELLESDDLEPARRRMAVRRMFDQIERLRIFVMTLLQMSRLDANVVQFKKETFPALELVKQAVDPIEALMDLHCQTLDLDVPPDIMIEGDKFWLADALVNVIKNCTEHTPDNGRVIIKATDNAVLTCLTISDTGPGIAKEDLPHIFERYHKGKDSGPNNIGIGLAFTRRVIHDMGGTIDADNGPDGGALFTINLFKVNV